MVQHKLTPSIPFTKPGYQKVLEELEKLQALRPEAVENLRKAREMGDLSENGYYKAARQRLSGLDGRIRHLDKLRKFGKVVESVQSDRVEIGTTVKLNDGSKEVVYMIVGGYESDPSKGTISYKSPLGSALLHKSAGAKVEINTPKGQRFYGILKIESGLT